MKVRRIASPQLEGASMLPGYAGRYYGAGAFPQENVNLGGTPRPQPQASPGPQVQQVMSPLGQTRPLLAYGLPAAAGLAVGGMLANKGEDPGSAVLGGTAAALGARGGLGVARLAGRFAPDITEIAQSAIAPVGKAVRKAKQELPADSKRAAILGQAREGLASLYSAAGQITRPMVQKTAAAGLVPSYALTAGLGGVAAGAIPGALGVPGFQQQALVDPESYGSSNSPGARYKAPTLQYM